MSTKDTVQKFARNVWLAGLGAYGKSAQAVTETIDKAYVESNQLFNDLVVKGAEIQTSLEAKIKQQTAFEQKVDEVREKLGLNQAVSDEQIDELNAKVDALTEIVAALAEKRLAEATKTQAETQAKASKQDAASDEVTTSATAPKDVDKAPARNRKPRTNKATA